MLCGVFVRSRVLICGRRIGKRGACIRSSAYPYTWVYGYDHRRVGTARVSVRSWAYPYTHAYGYAAERIGTRYVPVRVPAYGYTRVYRYTAWCIGTAAYRYTPERTHMLGAYRYAGRRADTRVAAPKGDSQFTLHVDQWLGVGVIQSALRSAA